MNKKRLIYYQAIASDCQTQVKDRFLIGYDSKENRKSDDIGFFHISKDGKKYKQHWITNTPGVQERMPQFAKYGNNYFVVWEVWEYKPKNISDLPWDYELRKINILGAVVDKTVKSSKV